MNNLNLVLNKKLTRAKILRSNHRNSFMIKLIRWIISTRIREKLTYKIILILNNSKISSTQVITNNIQSNNCINSQITCLIQEWLSKCHNTLICTPLIILQINKQIPKINKRRRQVKNKKMKQSLHLNKFLNIREYRQGWKKNNKISNFFMKKILLMF